MKKENFLTRRWNNILTIAMGIPIVVYIAIVLTTPLLTDFAGFLVMVISGIFY